MKILEEFLYGNIEPSEYDVASCREYKEALQQVIKQFAVKEFPDADFQAVANLLQRNHTRVLAFLIQHTVNCRWRNSGHSC